MPLRPSGSPVRSRGPGAWSRARRLHVGAPARVPSTTTRLRSMPRRWMPGGRDEDAGARLTSGALAQGAALVKVAGADEHPVPGARGVDRRLDRAELSRAPVKAPHAQDAVRAGGRHGTRRQRERGHEHDTTDDDPTLHGTLL